MSLQSQVRPRSVSRALPFFQGLLKRIVKMFYFLYPKNLKHCWYPNIYIQTFEFNWTHKQSLAFVLWLQVSGYSSHAATSAAGAVVRGLTYQDSALDVHRLFSLQELKGPERKAGIVCGATNVGLVGAIHRTSKGETECYCKIQNKSIISKMCLMHWGFCVTWKNISSLTKVRI